MTYQIDQSGKVEDTNKLTVVAYANGQIKSVKIGSAEKQKLLSVMRTLDHPKRNYVYKIFAALIYFLLADERVDSVVIDREYTGHEETIIGILIQLLNKNGKNIPSIRFDHVGKSSPAHKAALDVFRGKKEADLVVNAKEILRVLYQRK
jgi:hypothetical protein